MRDRYDHDWPILIEYKGHQGKLEKLDRQGQVDNRDRKNNLNFTHINGYAVNGAVHYANALLHYTAYENIIAIGVTGHKENDRLHLDIGVYLVSKANLGFGQRIGDFTDLSFLRQENFDAFIEQVLNLQLSPEELEELKVEDLFDEGVEVLLTQEGKIGEVIDFDDTRVAAPPPQGTHTHTCIPSHMPRAPFTVIAPYQSAPHVIVKGIFGERARVGQM